MYNKLNVFYSHLKKNYDRVRILDKSFDIKVKF